MLGVTNDVPVFMDVPPVIPVYQLMVPKLAVANNVTVPGPVREESVTLVIVGTGFMVAVTAVLLPVMHPRFVAST